MSKPEIVSANRLLFDLASRLGSLEGYLYSEEKVDKKYLPNWLQNIDRLFLRLSPEIRGDIRQDYAELLEKVQALLRRLYGDGDENTRRIAAMISDLNSRL
jgi:hypothetical protein